mgnify:CR=1 FL=1
MNNFDIFSSSGIRKGAKNPAAKEFTVVLQTEQKRQLKP